MHLFWAFRPIWLAISISGSSFWLVDIYFWSYFSWLAKSSCQNLKLAGNTFPPFPSFWSPAGNMVGNLEKNRNFTKTDMSSKLIYFQNWNATKTVMALKQKCHQNLMVLVVTAQGCRKVGTVGTCSQPIWDFGSHFWLASYNIFRNKCTPAKMSYRKWRLPAKLV